MAGSHSKLPASAAHRWMNCPGSVALTADIPRQPMSSYALDGTAAAWLAAKCLLERVNPIKYKDRIVSVLANGDCVLRKKHGAHQVLFDGEAIELLAVYTNFVQSLVRPDSRVRIEKRVSARHLDPVLSGTPDAAVWEPWGDDLHIIDLKWGQGVVVEAVDNEQLLIYALGLVNEEPFSRVHLTIVQPRAIHPDGPIRTCTISTKTLRSFGRKALGAIERTKDKNAPLSAGDWCQFCPASGQCPAQLKQAREVAAVEFDVIRSETNAANGPVAPKMLSDEQIGAILTHKKGLELWLKAVEGQAKERINSGKTIPGFKMVESVGHRKWMLDERRTVAKLRKKGFDVSAILDKKLKSPAQVEKILPKGGTFETKKDVEKYVNQLCERSRGATLASEDDKRPAYIPAQDEFSDLTGTTDQEED